MKKKEHHPGLASRWKEFSLTQQLANIGSETSRAIKARKKGDWTSYGFACERMLELFDYTIEDEKITSSQLKEVLRARMCCVDYFRGENEWGSSDKLRTNYFDFFALRG